MKKKLSKFDKDMMWGESGPYSEVHLITQTRIMNDAISRVFLVVEIKLNPFTFSYFSDNRDIFKDEPEILEVIDNAEFQGYENGFVTMAGEEELRDKHSFESAMSYKEMAVKTVLKMHGIIIEKFGLSSSASGIKRKDLPEKGRYIWDELQDEVVKADETVWSEESTISSDLGQKNGKLRYCIFFVNRSKKFGDTEARIIHEEIGKMAQKYKVDIEDVAGIRDGILFTVLIGPDQKPADFAGGSIASINRRRKIFKQDYFITNTERPSWKTIQNFLRTIK